jgi:hypothetical protein
MSEYRGRPGEGVRQAGDPAMTADTSPIPELSSAQVAQLRAQLGLRSRRPRRILAAVAVAVVVLGAAAGGWAAGHAHPRTITRTRTVTRTIVHTRTVHRTRWRTRTVISSASFTVGTGAIGCWQSPSTAGGAPFVTTAGTVPPDTQNTTCTIRAETPAADDQWLVTAPGGQQSNVTISEVGN